MTKKFFETLDSAFMAHFARRLADVIIEQSTELIREENLITPTTSVSTMLLLQKETSTTVTGIANAMGVTHQMAVQRIANLEKIGLVRRIINENDKRSRLIRLSKQGIQEALKLEKIVARAAKALANLESEIDCNLTQTIRQAELALRSKSLKQRQAELKSRN